MTTTTSPFTTPNLNFRAIRSPQYTQEHIETLYNDVLGSLKCVMGIVNNAAYLAMMNALDNIKQTPLYRQQAKRHFQLALKEYDEYERRLRYGARRGQHFFSAKDLRDIDNNNVNKDVQVTDEDLWDWFLDIGACAYKRSAKEVEMLHLQILHVFTKHQLPHRVALAHVCVATALLEYSCCMYDALIANFKQSTQLDFDPFFRDFRMSKVFYNFQQASALLCKTPKQDIDINQSTNVGLAFRAFERAIMKDINSGASADEALEQNKSLLDPEVYANYRREFDEAPTDPVCHID